MFIYDTFYIADNYMGFAETVQQMINGSLLDLNDLSEFVAFFNF